MYTLENCSMVILQIELMVSGSGFHDLQGSGCVISAICHLHLKGSYASPVPSLRYMLPALFLLLFLSIQARGTMSHCAVNTKLTWRPCSSAGTHTHMEKEPQYPCDFEQQTPSSTCTSLCRHPRLCHVHVSCNLSSLTWRAMESLFQLFPSQGASTANKKPASCTRLPNFAPMTTGHSHTTRARRCRLDSPGNAALLCFSTGLCKACRDLTDAQLPSRSNTSVGYRFARSL